MLRSIGFEMFMAASGEAMHMQLLPTTSDSATWVWDPAVFRPITDVGQEQSADRVYNYVIVKGENPNSTDPPVRSEAYIGDYTDPTYYIPTLPVQTVIGPRPYFYTSQYIRTQLQADAAALSELRRIRGLLQRVHVKLPYDPAVNVSDVVEVSRPGIGVTGRYVVDAVNMDLSGGLMHVVCEERRV